MQAHRLVDVAAFAERAGEWRAADSCWQEAEDFACGDTNGPPIDFRREPEKVGASTHRLTSNLRRALETARIAERRRVRELVSEIQTLALRVKETPPARADFFEIEELPEIWSGLSRPLWHEGVAVPLDGGLRLDTSDADPGAFARFRRGWPRCGDVFNAREKARLLQQA